MTTTFIITEAAAAAVLEIKNPWFIVKEDCVVGVYPSRAAARAAKATGIVGKVVSGNEAVFKTEEACGAEFGPEIVKPEIVKRKIASGSKKPETKPRNRSTVEKPVLLVWNLCDAMTGARRKEVVAAAVAKGVAFYTASTQYQLWYQVQKEMANKK